jgi:hypothetical protein
VDGQVRKEELAIETVHPGPRLDLCHPQQRRLSVPPKGQAVAGNMQVCLFTPSPQQPLSVIERLGSVALSGFRAETRNKI